MILSCPLDSGHAPDPFCVKISSLKGSNYLDSPQAGSERLVFLQPTAYCTDNATQAQIAEEAYEMCECIIDDLLPRIGLIAMGRTPL